MMVTIRQLKERLSALRGRPGSATAWEGRRTQQTRRWPACLAAILAAALVAGAITMVVAQNAAPMPQPSDRETGLGPAPNSPADAAKSLTSAGGSIEGYLAGGRWREGSKLVDVPGQFKISGDRVAFHSVDGKTRFACLENLNSERVARIVGESPETLDWSVQGTITEFKSENYLLVTQAVINSRARGPRSPADRTAAP
ncbi:MAG: hypothetical protein WD894_05615 [Pirellulales bacterium]